MTPQPDLGDGPMTSLERALCFLSGGRSWAELERENAERDRHVEERIARLGEVERRIHERARALEERV